MATYIPIVQWRAASTIVVKEALRACKDMKVSPMVRRALFEAGIVETNLVNLHYGDKDSVGFLQQRPSQGWGTIAQCLDPYHAATSFLKIAVNLEPHFKHSYTLAQAVQRSAYPTRYALAYSSAVYIIQKGLAL